MLPTGKLALVIILLVGESASAQTIAPPREPPLIMQPIDKSSLQPLRTRQKKRRKYLRRRGAPASSASDPARLAPVPRRLTPKQQRRKAQKAAQKAEQQAAKAQMQLNMRWSLALSFNQIATTGSHHAASTVEPGVHMAFDWAPTPVATDVGGMSLWLGVHVANFAGSTVYDGLFFRYSYNYFGPSGTIRWYGGSEGSTALDWSFGLKGALLALSALQEGQSNADPSEFEFGGKKGVIFDSPGLLIEASGSYHLHNLLALDLAAGMVQATDKTYSFISLGVSGYLGEKGIGEKRGARKGKSRESTTQKGKGTKP